MCYCRLDHPFLFDRSTSDLEEWLWAAVAQFLGLVDGADFLQPAAECPANLFALDHYIHIYNKNTDITDASNSFVASGATGSIMPFELYWLNRKEIRWRRTLHDSQECAMLWGFRSLYGLQDCQMRFRHVVRFTLGPCLEDQCFLTRLGRSQRIPSECLQEPGTSPWDLSQLARQHQLLEAQALNVCNNLAACRIPYPKMRRTSFCRVCLWQHKVPADL